MTLVSAAVQQVAAAADKPARKAVPTKAAPPKTDKPAAKPVSAATVQLRGPIKISAERAELERREYALYRGRVKLTSADMVLTGDRLELRQPTQGQFEARLTGTPARLDHPGDDKNPPVAASAQLIVYDTRTANVDLTGDVQLARGTDQLSSSELRYNLAARRITASGSGKGQVQLIMTPPPPAEKPAQKPQNTAPKPKLKKPKSK